MRDASDAARSAMLDYGKCRAHGASFRVDACEAAAIAGMSACVGDAVR
jgi:uncharacterized protein with PIN domain